jgi:hypothetical protein
MSGEDEILALIDVIYEAAFDSTLWATALPRLADTPAQIGLLKLDRRAHTFDSVAPRTDPAMDAVFKKYWAFHNQLLPRAIARRAVEIFMLDSLIPRGEFVTNSLFLRFSRGKSEVQAPVYPRAYPVFSRHRRPGKRPRAAKTGRGASGDGALAPWRPRFFFSNSTATQ